MHNLCSTNTERKEKREDSGIQNKIHSVRLMPPHYRVYPIILPRVSGQRGHVDI